MKTKQAANAIRRFLETLDGALDYDPYQEVRLRLERLERDSRSREGRLSALSQKVPALRIPS
jgi:hypothetical protein